MTGVFPQQFPFIFELLALDEQMEWRLLTLSAGTKRGRVFFGLESQVSIQSWGARSEKTYVDLAEVRVEADNAGSAMEQHGALRPR